jgi:hypothetical protein
MKGTGEAGARMTSRISLGGWSYPEATKEGFKVEENGGLNLGAVWPVASMDAVQAAITKRVKAWFMSINFLRGSMKTGSAVDGQGHPCPLWRLRNFLFDLMGDVFGV